VLQNTGVGDRRSSVYSGGTGIAGAGAGALSSLSWGLIDALAHLPTACADVSLRIEE
jgi:hypothetical protein